MAVVDVIDLTTPPHSVIVIDDDLQEGADVETSREKKNRKKRRKESERDSRESRRNSEDRKDPDIWKHDKFQDEDRPRRGEKRKRNEEDISRSNKRRERSLTPLLWTIDINPNPEARLDTLADVILEPPRLAESKPVQNGLLLPVHVTVSSQELASQPHDTPPLSPVSVASGIDFLDDDRAVGAPRYFQDIDVNLSRLRGPCKKCGDSDHDFKNCPNMICLTCGAWNEHGSRSCPILRFCFNCRAKGHLARDCPRIETMDHERLNRQDCERCGSWKHHGTNCPTLWRIYTYMTDSERDAVLASRESKRHLDFDNGGEGYIARDRWCYNCGENGHLGDDCEVVVHNHDKPDDYSAFGSYNELTGPFASMTSDVPKFERRPREWEEGGQFDDGYGFSAEGNVGRKGRENAKAKALEAQRLIEQDDEEPDWFNRNRAASTKDKPTPKSFSFPAKTGLPPKPPMPTIHIGFRGLGFPSNRPDPAKPPSARLPERPSLRERIDTGDGRTSDHSHRSHGEKRRKDRRKNKEASTEARSKDHQDVRDSNREKGPYSSRDGYHRGHASRWRGGYDV
ncbi:hypothetical protein K439DRAFT_1379129 [Ramaria rubella]|nr:hypothetical protein K439DRAFT_1379129 [Ramaria rubella]